MGAAFNTQGMGRALAQTDVVRLDHFIGFANYWAIPAGAPDARAGAWAPGPGRALFDALEATGDPLPLVAEDLVEITPESVRMRKRQLVEALRRKAVREARATQAVS